MDDEECIRRIRRGEKEYLDNLIRRHYSSIEKYCYWKTGSQETAQDITQETFYRFFRCFDRYTHGGKLRAYLYTIARRLCSDYLQDGRPLALENADIICGDDIPMEEAVESGQSVRQMLSVLPPDQREILLLRFVHDMKYREIAEITGISICLVQYKMRRGLTLLRKELERGKELEQAKVKRNGKASAAAPNTSI
ncbi:RNA polymerase sigma factor [Paenibacillus sp. HN-1]|uniref:RNA polymerase sigma factor n=1 Tax=Paenibacillus TaxID=44249 RepID=UPI001CAA2935|nr:MULTISPECIES: RNA polymerase sigma factor [Paenibacillus]MBY9079642.1 RNA polymerase sigma factor [Paenibacillus sp. CGMCC 1.18879]MBY9084331.1 RNA polymerase sigma factor [Paenibacillus sinensis]